MTELQVKKSLKNYKSFFNTRKNKQNERKRENNERKKQKKKRGRAGHQQNKDKAEDCDHARAAR
jgi:hypothetical protein